MARARNPGRQRAWSRHVRPWAEDVPAWRSTGSGAASPRCRHERQRHSRVTQRDRPAAGGKDAGDLRRRFGALHAERRGLGDESRLIDERIDLAARHVGADVEEQQQPAQQKERDNQQRRHEADEDVGQGQLAPHPPQQLLLGVDEEAVAEDQRAGHQRDVAGGVDQLEHRPGAERQPQRVGDRFHQHARGDGAAAERAGDPAADQHASRRGIPNERWRERWHAGIRPGVLVSDLSLEYPLKP